MLGLTDHDANLACLPPWGKFANINKNEIEFVDNNKADAAFLRNSQRIYAIKNVNDPNEAADTLKECISDILSEATVRKKIVSKTRLLNPWITPGIVTSIRIRDKWLYSSDPNAERHYKECRSKIRKLCELAKNNY